MDGPGTTTIDRVMALRRARSLLVGKLTGSPEQMDAAWQSFLLELPEDGAIAFPQLCDTLVALLRFASVSIELLAIVNGNVIGPTQLLSDMYDDLAHVEVIAPADS